MAIALAPQRILPTGDLQVLKGSQDLVLAGYASVELVDKQGDLITKNALNGAFNSFMESPFRNVQLSHSNIQVGEVIPSYVDSTGNVWKSEVDDSGLFVVVRLRDDIEKAREVANEIRKGNLRGFSIGGQAFKRMQKSDPERGTYNEISNLELHEVTICEKGINPEATFRILKEDVEKMTDEPNAMNELSNVLARLDGRLEAMEKGEMPDFMDKKKPPVEEEGDEDENDEEEDEEKMAYSDFEKSELSDVVSEEYLNYLEGVAKSSGVDVGAARDHFDVNKANLGSSPKEIGDAAERFGGQAKGRQQSEGKPSSRKAEFGAGGKGKDSTLKGFVNPASVSSSDLESAYEVFKAAALEQQYKAYLGEQFQHRFDGEIAAEVQKAEADAFDARAPIADIEKAVTGLAERIDRLTASGGVSINKAEIPSVEVPETTELANMSWDDVHRLAGKAVRGN